MADADSRRGRIIAIDGSRGADLVRASVALADRLRQRGLVCGISRWDASGIFNELALAGREERSMSPRTLTLAYVADLAFRLQWEIGPVLASGGVVIAAPYLETAVSIGMAYGLPESWLRDVLRFAPLADANCLTDERKLHRGWRRRADRGYAEYCASLLEPGEDQFGAKRTRKSAIRALEKHSGPKAWRLSERGVARAAKRLVPVKIQSAAAPRPPKTRSSR
jgi:thymidylate kinase